MSNRKARKAESRTMTIESPLRRTTVVWYWHGKELVMRPVALSGRGPE